MKLTKEYLKDKGWIEKAGIMVLYSTPRIGWKEDGTLIIGWHEYSEKVFNADKLYEIISREIKVQDK